MERLAPEIFRTTTGDAWTHGRAWVQVRVAEARFAGTALFGTLEEDDALALFEAVDATMNALPGGQRALLDGRELLSATPGAYAATVAFFKARSEAFAARVERFVAVRPEGMLGAVAAGFFAVVPAPYPVAIVTDVDAAVAELGIEPRTVELLLRVAREARRDPSEVEDLAGRIGEVLEGKLRFATIEDAAAALGTSVRSLQRRLQESGTSFSAELASARVRAAEKLLGETDRSIAWIGSEVGFASPAAFSTAFQRATGEAPSAYRKRIRGA